ncbi:MULTISPECIES: hypothetical protein [unclassified Pseudofrankia]|uniref:hypothetical protein n=1 Tax=unclassified Pseudofrankia TaxID=2994372 RepID=UPI0008D97A45|nr:MULTISPECIES: hypothetical protein [unclassified Pseudofrankia]MDT3444336.1 hypothetical protein [Pseudofrankia sp. BMG5.37]OHV43339.1 hypothetical protein BCD48_28535 [Pseudofrankia sp. BMG5.36]
MGTGEPSGEYSGQYQPTGWYQGYPQAGQNQPYQQQYQPPYQPPYEQQNQQPYAPQYQPATGYQWAPPEGQVPPAGQNPWYQSAGRQPSPSPRRPWLLPVLVVGGLVVVAGVVLGVLRLVGHDGGSGETTVPSAFVGTWYGTVGGAEMSLDLKDGKVGDIVGATTYAGACTETVTLLEVGDDSSVRVHEAAQPGDEVCTDEDITLMLQGSGRLSLHYESHAGSDPDGTVILTRNGGGRAT